MKNLLFCIVLILTSIAHFPCLRKFQKSASALETNLRLTQNYIGTNLGLSTLLSNQMALSPNGVYKLIMQSDGNLVLSSVAFKNQQTTDQPIWATMTNRSSNLPNKAVMQSDGNFVIYDNKGAPIWSTLTFARGQSPYNLLLQDNGNLVLYDGKFTPLWATGTFKFPIGTAAVTSLNSNQFVKSPNGLYKLIMQTDGNMVLYTGKNDEVPLWATMTNRASNLPNVANMQNDGNFVIYDKNGTPLWNSNTFKKGIAPYQLLLQDDGNLVLYDATSLAIWASGTYQVPGSRITNLNSNDAVVSQNGVFKVIMQTDGNFVLYAVGTSKTISNEKPLWASNTWTNLSNQALPYRATMQQDGNFVLYDRNNVPKFATGTSNKGSAPYSMVLQDDGNLVIYDKNYSAIWTSGTNQVTTSSSPASNDSNDSSSSIPSTCSQTVFGYKGKCIGDSITSYLTNMSQNQGFQKIINELLGPINMAMGQNTDVCIGDFSGQIFHDSNYSGSLYNQGCTNNYLNPSNTYSVVGMNLNNIPCPQPQQLAGCFVFDSCGTFYFSVNGGLMQCVANFVSGGLAEVVAPLTNAINQMSLGFSRQRSFMNQGFKLVTRSGSSGMNEVQVNLKAHFMFNMQLQLPIDYEILPDINLNQLVNFNLSGVIFVDFGPAAKTVENMINIFLKPNRATFKQQVNNLLKSGAEISAQVIGTLVVNFQNLTRGFINNMSITVAQCNILITTGGPNSSSGLPGGVYAYISGSAIQNLANLVSNMTSRYSSILNQMGIKLPSTPQVDEGSSISFFIDNQYAGFRVKLNNFAFMCLFQFSNQSGSCNFGNSFFSGISDGVNFAIKEAKQFFDNTGKDIQKFSKDVENSLNNAANKVQNYVQNEAKVVAQQTMQEAQKMASQIQQNMQNLKQQFDQEARAAQAKVEQAWNTATSDAKNFFKKIF